MQLIVGLDEGAKVGRGVGASVGSGMGFMEGKLDSIGDGGSVGSADGTGMGIGEGACNGKTVGGGVGFKVGEELGDGMGIALGLGAGITVGIGVGISVGTGLGRVDGGSVGIGEGIRDGNSVGNGRGTGDGFKETVGSAVGLRIKVQIPQDLSQIPALGHSRQNETEQYEVTYSQKSPTSTHWVGNGVGYKVTVGRAVGGGVGTSEGFRVLAIAEIEVVSTEISRLWSAAETAAVKSSEDSVLETLEPSSADDERSPSPTVESEVVISNVTPHVTKSKLRRRLSSEMVT